jgi:hypothetical protein
MKLYTAIASALVARENCRESGNDVWAKIWEERLARYDSMLPGGSGFDNGSVVVKADSGDTKIVIATAYHHMDEVGGYTEWTDHHVTIKPNLVHGITVHVGGRNINDIKDYIGEVFETALTADIDDYGVAWETVGRIEG